MWLRGRWPNTLAAIGLLLLPLGLASCRGDPELIADCEPHGGVTPICGFSNPEDLALVSDGAWLIASQRPPTGKGGGSLTALRVSDEKRQLLYPTDSSDVADRVVHHYAEGWGDANCPGKPDSELFAPHGIDFGTGDSGRPSLAVINHGGREAVELFAVRDADGTPGLSWLGCVPIPQGVMANDVVLLPDGGLAITNMMPSGSGLAGLMTRMKLSLGVDTGSILTWDLNDGWSEIADSAGSGPNGIEVSRDGSEIYFTEWAGQRLVKLRLLETGSGRRQSVDLPHHPDNLTWTRDRLLLVAGQEGSLLEIIACDGEGGSCAVPLSVLAVDPSTLEATVVLQHAGQAAGAASVALQVGDQIYLGSFSSDRIARVDYQP